MCCRSHFARGTPGDVYKLMAGNRPANRLGSANRVRSAASGEGELEQPALQRRAQARLDGVCTEAGARLEIRDREALVEPQRIQHELERQIDRGHRLALADAARVQGRAAGPLDRRDLLEVGARLARLLGALD